ncbi:MAG TPA: hypothetical protein VJL83_00425 [Patescibacteria group bacterium]|nr:hypothetical protein [Patescibacteria group bacterium]
MRNNETLPLPSGIAALAAFMRKYKDAERVTSLDPAKQVAYSADGKLYTFGVNTGIASGIVGEGIGVLTHVSDEGEMQLINDDMVFALNIYLMCGVGIKGVILAGGSTRKALFDEIAKKFDDLLQNRDITFFKIPIESMDESVSIGIDCKYQEINIVLSRKPEHEWEE